MSRTLGLLGAGLLVAAVLVTLTTRQPVAAALDDGVITGVVTSGNGPEAGVWVIADTDDLDTHFRKIVVTNNAGRFLLPELPEATYSVWVRGYGLVDSDQVMASPGTELELRGTIAATPQEAAEIHPASYWYSLIEPPRPDEFPGSRVDGNGISPGLQTQGQWIDAQKQGCMLCHQLGTKITREVPNLDQYDSPVAAWDARVQFGQHGASMSNVMSRFGRRRGLEMFADWSDRIAGGEVPPPPPRPAGVERNVVLTMWEWGPTSVAYVHDEIATDRRDPTVNAHGPIYGVEFANDHLTIVDPVTHSATMLDVPTRTERSTVEPFFTRGEFVPSPYAGSESVHDNPANPHNPMMDAKGRVWITTQIRPRANPDWCREGSDHPSAKYFPLTRGGRQAGFYDPTAQKFVLIDTCYGTHHLQFAEDDDDTLYFSTLGSNVFGWINTRLYDETGDERTAQAWCPTVLDTNSDGRITKPWNGDMTETSGVGTETRRARREEIPSTIDPSLDTRISIGSYGVIVSPVDDAVWIASTRFPGRIARLERGDNPPETCITEVYEVPSELQDDVDYADSGIGPRGIDVDRNGVIWTALSGSSDFASFDRRKCAVLNGPRATGRHCNEGWTFYEVPGPKLKGTDHGADNHYYNWVDQFDTLGLGENIPIANGSNSDSLLALMPNTGEWVVLRVPYPLGFHSRGLDGRIDDPNAGWKGRGVYATYGARVGWHTEEGWEARPNLVKFQVRPGPLAK